MLNSTFTTSSGGAVPSPQLLYELALAIGGSLDTQVMLRTALDAFLRKLNCASGSVYLWRHPGATLAPAFAIPFDPQRNESIQAVRERLPAQPTQDEFSALVETLPLAITTDDHGAIYLLPLGKIGILALVRYGDDLPQDWYSLLTPLTAKLAEASHVCLEHETLSHAYERTLLERNMLHALLDGTPTIVFALDPEGRFVVSEGHGLERIGRLPSEVVGESIFDVYSEIPVILDNIRAALAGQQRAVTVDVRGRSFDALYTPVIDDAGAVVGVVGVAHDVTDRKAAVDTLGAVLNTVGEGILTVDGRGAIIMVNQALERMLGHAQGALVGRHLDTLLPELDIVTSASFADTQLAAILGRRVEMEAIGSQQRTLPVEVCFNEMIIGDETYYAGSMRDLTTQKEYDRLRDEFVATVSHELRTPLASIMGWTETLLTGHPGPLTEMQQKVLNTVYSSAQRLNRLIEEILTVSRIQRGTLRLKQDHFDPAQLFSQLREPMTQLATRQQVQLHFSDLWRNEVECTGDMVLVEQAVANLISNAIKFSAPGQVVEVRSYGVHGGWRVEVEDHGMGIPEADLPDLFQRFTRGSNAKKAHIQGTGLGLYVAKAIIEGHGGEIHLTSQEGFGTTVWFEVPCKAATAQTPTN
ncbi:MAG: PAS domain S-box protein [Anaerolineales bacterium]|nr:PAS domain S-box protein [Anaerolineales bacterium]